MIEVPFNIERHDAESHNPLSTWIQRNSEYALAKLSAGEYQWHRYRTLL
jgi:hypothetical protein